MTGLHLCPTCFANFFTQIGVIDHAPYGIGQRSHITRRDDKAMPTIFDQLTGAIVGGSHDRQSRCHGLKDHKCTRILDGWQYEYVRLSHCFRYSPGQACAFVSHIAWQAIQHIGADDRPDQAKSNR